MTIDITDNFQGFIKSFERSCKKAKRNPKEIKIIGATKGQSLVKINKAISLGMINFGENFLQEAEKKIEEIQLPVKWHFIGSIQRRKTKKISNLFDWVHSLDKITIAENLDFHRQNNKSPLNICVQINIDNEKNKSGIKLNEAKGFINELKKYKNLKVRGLMAIPKPRKSFAEQKEIFSLIKKHFLYLNNFFPYLDTLSMGMSEDYEAAINEGSTIIRIGTKIFGPRQ